MSSNIWIESDLAGSQHVMVKSPIVEQPFKYCTFFYRYPFTSNASVIGAAEDMAIKLGAKIPVHRQSIGIPCSIQKQIDMLNIIEASHKLLSEKNELLTFMDFCKNNNALSETVTQKSKFWAIFEDLGVSPPTLNEDLENAYELAASLIKNIDKQLFEMTSNFIKP